MNILLVDDNQYVLEGLLDGIDFSGLGFSQVYTAKSAGKARELMDSNSIQIVITDIEMPNGSGLELLEWINEVHPGTVTLFCTSFADFNYAKEAVRLHCFDYYVKPIQYSDFTMHVVKAIEEVQRLESEKQIQKYGKYWMDNQWNNKADFWYKYLYRLNQVTDVEIREEITGRKLEYTLDQEIDICIIKIGKSIKIQMLTEENKDFIFRNISEEIFVKEFYVLEGLLITANNTMTVILSNQNKEEHRLRKLCGELLDCLHKYVAQESNCYYREHIKVREARKAVLQMEEISLDDISKEKRVIDYQNYVMERKEEYSADLNEWESLFRNKQTENLMAKINAYMAEQMRNRNMTGQFLREIRSSIVQISGTILQENKIEAYKLFDDAYYDTIFTESVKSVSNMQRFAEYVIGKSIDYIKEIEKSQTFITKIIRYMEENYNRNITRDELENIAYVNINYLSRIFKQETGKSLHNYLMGIRIDRAIAMLQEGKTTVSEVSLSVGYDNFSYFSRLFKDKTGYTPKEYKNMFSENKKNCQES